MTFSGLSTTASELEMEVLKAPEAVALDFYQASCPPCRALGPRLERVARQYQDRLPVYRVDIDRDMPVAERFGVKSIPTILVFRSGREVARLDGLITDQELTTAFDREAA
jgi:thioredoxin